MGFEGVRAEQGVMLRSEMTGKVGMGGTVDMEGMHGSDKHHLKLLSVSSRVEIEQEFYGSYFGDEEFSLMSNVTPGSVSVDEKNGNGEKKRDQAALPPSSLQFKYEDFAREKLLAHFLDLTNAGPEARKKLEGTSVSLVQRKESFIDVLKPFMKVFTTRSGWRYAELWASAKGGIEDRRSLSSTDDRNAVLEMKHSVLSADDLSLERFRNYSRQRFVIERECLPGRVWRSRSVEWMGCATDARTSARADMAFRCGITSGFAIPVVVGHHIVSVLCFFDNRPHEYDAKSINIAFQSVATLASAWQITNNVAGTTTTS